MSDLELPRLPQRRDESHKGDYGRVLIVAGSRGMTGAAALSGMGALRSGAGLVYLAVPRSCQATVATFDPGYLTVPLEEDADGRIADRAMTDLCQWSQRVDVAAFGPGLGRGEGVRNVVAECYRRWSCPLVVDADGLNALASLPGVLPHHAGPRILTPHPGEFRRLTGGEEQEGQDESSAVAFAARHNVVLVLKGHRTLVTDGERVVRNETGNPGMATGGTGDVLTGVIAALVGQGMPPFDAARLGVHVHGLAGDLQAESLGQVALVARDLVDGLSRAWKTVQS